MGIRKALFPTPNHPLSKSVCSMLSKPNHANCISIRVHLARHRLPIFRFENQFTSDHQLPTEQFTPFSFRSKPKSLYCELGVDCISFCAVVLFLFFFVVLAASGIILYLCPALLTKWETRNSFMFEWVWLWMLAVFFRRVLPYDFWYRNTESMNWFLLLWTCYFSHMRCRCSTWKLKLDTLKIKYCIITFFWYFLVAEL